MTISVTKTILPLTYQWLGIATVRASASAQHTDELVMSAPGSLKASVCHRTKHLRDRAAGRFPPPSSGPGGLSVERYDPCNLPPSHPQKSFNTICMACSLALPAGGEANRRRLYTIPRTISPWYGGRERRIPYWPPKHTKRRKRPILIRIELDEVMP